MAQRPKTRNINESKTRNSRNQNIVAIKSMMDPITKQFPVTQTAACEQGSSLIPNEGKQHK